MLILSRRESECIHLGEDIVLTSVSLGNDKVRIGVQAPPGVRILRSELEVESATSIDTWLCIMRVSTSVRNLILGFSNPSFSPRTIQ